MGLRRGLALASLLALGAVAACGAFGADPEGSTGATPPATPPNDGGDAGTSSIDASDSATPIDSGPPFCSTLTPKPIFCADFSPPNAELGWQQGPSTHGGSIVATADQFTSPPQALVVKVPDVSANVDDIDDLWVDLPIAGLSGIEVRLQLYLDDPPVNTNPIYVVKLAYSSGGTPTWTESLAYGAKNVQVVGRPADNSFATTTSFGVVTTGQWIPIVITQPFTPGVAASATINGIQKGLNGGVDAGLVRPHDSLRLSLGVVTGQAGLETSAATYRFDDVVVTAR